MSRFLKVDEAPAGFYPPDQDWPLKGPKLSGCLVVILALIAAGGIATSVFLYIHPVTVLAVQPTHASDVTPTYPVPTRVGESDERHTQTATQTPSSTPTSTATQATSATQTPTPTKTQTPTQTNTRTPTKTPKPRAASHPSSNSSGADQGGCNPCSGSVQDGSIWIPNQPQGPGIVVTEYSIASPTPAPMTTSGG